MSWLRCSRNLLFLIVCCRTAFAEDATKYQAILDRLDALEKQNAALLDEIHSLQQTILAERDRHSAEADEKKETAEVTNQRVAEQDQSKVGASQRYPVSLTGMLLFDAYSISGSANPQFQARFPDYGEGTPGGGASLRQSIIGLEFHGPDALGAKVAGSFSMDFSSTNGDDSIFKIRRGDVSLDWTSQSLLFGQEKPLISPYEPASFARVAVPPLAGAGNLWIWTPQVRYARRIALGPSTQLALQGAVLATYENYGSAPLAGGLRYSPVRPAAEVRVALSHKWSDRTSFEFGIGSHASQSHVAGVSVPSRVVSADLKITPLPWFELTGTVLRGSNFANLGGLPTAVTVRGQDVIAIRGSAGWLQLAFPVTSRLTFDLYGGKQTNFARDLSGFQLAGSSIYAGNVLYRIAPNVILGFEGSSQDISYIAPVRVGGTRYDATIAYLF